eukprot:jgi/Psemu1/284575/fgenesh1_pg.57_\
MTFRTFFLALVFINRVIAIEYLQAFYDNEQENPKVFNTKALVPVTSTRLAFVSTISSSSAKDLKPLLVKIRKNYSVEWAKEYVPVKNAFTIDVEDVLYDGFYYVICGKLKILGSSLGFLMKVGRDGTSKNAMTCDNEAAIVKVKDSDLNVESALRMDEDNVKSQFHKIIKYKTGFAVVGERTSGCEQQCGKCKDTDTNLLVGVVDGGGLAVKFLKHYGSTSAADDERIDERGFSASVSRGKLVVTGSTETLKLRPEKKCKKKSMDILVVKIDDSGNVKWSKCYDVQNKDDFGTSIITKDTSIQVAGETKTGYLTSFNKRKKDVFLMKLDTTKEGKVLKTVLFGLVKSMDNGALSGKLDMHQTTSGKAIIMGNTQHPDVSPYRPYLIAPTSRSQKCVEETVDVTRKDYPMETKDETSKAFDLTVQCVVLKAQPFELEREQVCPTGSIPPSEAPSEASSEASSEPPTSESPTSASSTTTSPFPSESPSVFPSASPTENCL